MHCSQYIKGQFHEPSVPEGTERGSGYRGEFTSRLGTAGFVVVDDCIFRPGTEGFAFVMIVGLSVENRTAFVPVSLQKGK